MPRQLWLLLIGLMINVTGSSFLWPLNTIYIHDHLGKSLSVAGLVLMLNSGATIIGNVVGGFLFDKIGSYKTIVTGGMIVLSAAIGLVLLHDWPYYILFLVVLGFGGGLVFPAMYAMAGSIWPSGGRKAFDAVYVAQNLGVAVGSALGGFIASFSFTFIFIGNAAVYLVFFLLVVFTFKGISTIPIKREKIETSTERKINKGMISLFILTIGYAFCWFAYVQWQSTISSYTQTLGIPLDLYSLLWTVNGALIVFGQPIVSVLAGKMFKSIKTQIIFGICIFILSFIVVSQATVFQGFLISMIIITIGEMFVWPAIPTIANQLAPPGKVGMYQGFVNGTASFGRMFGPLVGGIVVDHYGMSAAFLVVIILLIVAIFTTVFYDKATTSKEKQKGNVAM